MVAWWHISTAKWEHTVAAFDLLDGRSPELQAAECLPQHAANLDDAVSQPVPLSEHGLILRRQRPSSRGVECLRGRLKHIWFVLLPTNVHAACSWPRAHLVEALQTDPGALGGRKVALPPDCQ